MKLFGRKNGKGAPVGSDAGGRRKRDRLAGTGAGGAPGQSRAAALPALVAHRLTKDLARIQRFYRANGYYEATIRSARVVRETPHRVRVQIDVAVSTAASSLSCE